MKKKIIFIITFLLIIGATILIAIDKYNMKEELKKDVIINETKNEKKEKTKIDLNEEVVKENIKKEIEQKEDNKVDVKSNNDIENSNKIESEINKENNSKETTSNNNITNNSNTQKVEKSEPIIVEKEEKIPETVYQEPKEDLTKIPNPNDFLYSITGGKVEFNTNEGCTNAGNEINEIDTVDINYFRCYEVISKGNTIMGYYLNIFCKSGDCNNKYKSMINMSKYN